MTHRNIAIAAISLTLLSGAAMAQGNGNPRLYAEEQGNTAVASDAAAGVFDSVGAYGSDWSSNPGTFNSQTAEPGFVDHSHGHP